MSNLRAAARSWVSTVGEDTAGNDGELTPFGGIQWLLAILAFLFPLAYVDAFLVPSFTPRMALVLVVLPIGAVRLVRAAWDRDLAATAALVFLVLCAVATVVGDAPLWNLRGGFGRESSLVFLGGVLSLWALARDTSVDGRKLITAGSLLGLATTGVIGFVQLLVEPTGFLQMIGSRPSGLMVNPVYFGPAMAGAAVFVAHLSARRSIGIRVGAGAVVLFVTFANLSGSRAAMIGLGVGIIAALVIADTARSRIALGASTAGGLLGSAVITRLSGGRDTLGRATGGSDGRWDVWNYAWDAFRDRPLTGYGLGQFRVAVQEYFEPEFVGEYLAGGGGVAWPDAHNVIVQYAVVGGVFTVFSLLAFAGLAGRLAHGPAAWAVGALTISWLLQPVTLVTAPIAAIWLGVASSRPVQRPTDSSEVGDASLTSPRTDLLLFLVGLLISVAVLGLDRQLDRAVARGDIEALNTWADIAPDDPVIAATAASVNTRSGLRDSGLEWSERAVELEPKDAVVITDHAIRLFEAGRTDESASTIRIALEVDPYNPYALQVAAAIGSALDDDELIVIAQSRGCLVLEELCDDG